MELVKDLGFAPRCGDLSIKLMEIWETVENTGNQIILQNPFGTDVDDWSTGAGGRINQLKINKEEAYCHLNSSLKGTVVDEYFMWLKLIGNFQPYRTRLMMMEPKMCYMAHADFSPRLHFPVFTNLDAMFVFPDHQSLHHLPADGSTYWVDTRERHTFMNANFNKRLHLVMGI